MTFIWPLIYLWTGSFVGWPEEYEATLELVLRAPEMPALEAALDRYRYAVAWIGSDSWDWCSDCSKRLEWARSLDPAGKLTNQRVAEIGKTFLAAATLPQNVDELAYLRAENEKLRTALRSFLQWTSNWDVPFAEEPEWIGDLAFARATLSAARPRNGEPTQ